MQCLGFRGGEKDAEAAKAGEKGFAQACVACHGPEGKGMQALGAPNLTDNTWLYGSTYEWIRETVMNGRQNQMPAQSGRLSEDRIQILAAYVYSLSNWVGRPGATPGPVFSTLYLRAGTGLKRSAD